MKPGKIMQNSSGQIILAGDSIEYSTPEKTISYCQNWSLPINQVKIIGEYTNSDGPHLDDYFFVFVMADGSWRQASFYSDGREVFQTDLGKRLGQPLECGLCNSTSLKSRVLWPKGLTGQPLFTFARAPEPKRLFARLLEKTSPHFLFELSEPVRQALNL